MKRRQIFCDMDGVLADFNQAKEDFGYDELSDDEMWEAIHRYNPNWFLNLPLMPDARKLWNYINKIGDVTILTAIPKAKRGILGVAEQKIKWVHRHFNKVPIITCYGVEKQNHCADSLSILIDDSGRNIGQWIRMGGDGILHHSAKETIACLKEMVCDLIVV